MKKTLLILVAVAAVIVALMGAFPEQTTRLAFQLERAANGLGYETVTVAGESWHYLVGGPEDADVVLLLHGFGADKDSWTRFLGNMTGAYRVIAPDLPGFGQSARHEDWDYSLFLQRERVHAFAQALGLTRFHLAGHSMGGHLSILYAHEYPEQVISLALMNNGGIDPPTPSEFMLHVNAGKNDLIIRSRKDFDAMMMMVFEEPPFAPWPMKTALSRRAIADADFNEAIFAALLRDFDTDLRPILASIECPVFILWGDNDRILHVSSVTVMQESLPAADVVIMENMGHMPIVERPAETAEYYRAFLHAL